MKKNTMMRLASALLVAVLLTTCAIAGTFAKYTITSAPTTDTAQVAKWGVQITANGTTFATQYIDAAHDGDAADAAVVASGTAKLVAPGTNGTLAAMAISGSPEVDVSVTYASTLTLTGFDAYCPIEITVGATTYKVGTGAAPAGYEYAADVAELKSKVETAINGYTAYYEANTDLSTATTPVVSWAWKFTGNDDVKDTALGDAAAGIGGGTAAEITLSITTTVSQEDLDVLP